MSRRPLLVTVLAAALLASTLGTASAQSVERTPAFLFSSYGPTVSDNVVLAHNDALLSAVRASTDPPPVVAWKMAVLNIAMYDAWAAYDTRATPVVASGWTRRSGPAVDRIEAMSQAALAAATLLYPNSIGPFNDRVSRVRANHGTGSAGAQEFGAAVGRAVYDAREDDLRYYTNVGGTAPDPGDPFAWRPLSGQPANGLLPQWGKVRPFALPNGWQSTAPYAPDGPEIRNANVYYTQQISDIVLKTQTLTDRDKAMAIYWADGPRSETPPGHWNLIAQAVSRAKGHSLAKDVEVFLALSTALLDAGIVAWQCKYVYNWGRPITLIRHQYAATTVKLWDGASRPGGQWVSYVPTPPFPEYTSGHSTFSGAAARALRSATGTDAAPDVLRVTIPKGSHPRKLTGEPLVTSADPTGRDVTLFWSSYSAMARDAGLSRLLGGIHFTDADVEGRGSGDAVGTAAHSRVRAHLNGKA